MEYIYVLDPTKEFKGNAYTIIRDGKTFSGQTFEELIKEPGCENMIQLSEKEFNEKYYTPYIESYRSNWKEVTKEEWWDLYECLPPFKCGEYKDAFFFCCPEATVAYMTTWGARRDGKYYMATRDMYSKLNELIKDLP